MRAEPDHLGDPHRPNPGEITFHSCESQSGQAKEARPRAVRVLADMPRAKAGRPDQSDRHKDDRTR